MREKYETLKLDVLKDIAKSAGIKGCSSMNKEKIIDLLVEKEKEEIAKKNEAVLKEIEAEKAKTVKVKAEKAKTEKAPAKEKVNAKEKPVKKEANKEEAVKETAPAEGEAENEVRKIVIGKPPFEQEYDPRLDTHIRASGICEIMPDNFGFIRSKNFLTGDQDIYIGSGLVKKFGIRTGDVVSGNIKIKSDKEKFSPLLFIDKINGNPPEMIANRYKFEEMTPVFPKEKIRLDIPGAPVSMRIVDLVSPVGKGQRGMIVSQPKAGKTTLLKDIAKSVLYSNRNMHMIILLIDERPEEVTDIKEAIKGTNVEVIYSTFDETPEHHKRVAEMVIERAKRLVESRQDVIILLDSITRLTRAYNQVIPPSGRTLSGGLDPAALHMPKKFFGAARTMREGGSLTILATALVDTGSKMDDVVYEEFKGTGNMELVLDRKLSEKRVFPAIDIPKSGTRNEHLLLNPEELNAISLMRRGFNGLKPEEAVDKVIDLFSKTKNNTEFVAMMNKVKWY